MPLQTTRSQLWLPLDGLGTLQEQIYRAMRDRITVADLAPGTRLPSTRALARELDVSRTTTQAAFDQLVAEGYLETRRGSGTFVASDLPVAPEPPRRAPQRRAIGVRWSRYAERIGEAGLGDPFAAIRKRRPARFELLYGIVDPRLFPAADWRRAVNARAAAGSLRGLTYGSPAGLRSLREAIAGYLGRARGIDCRADEIVIVSGAQHGLQLVTRMLCDPGDSALLEHPWYPAARNVLLAEGATPVLAPVDPHGIDIDAVDPRELRSCRLAYVTPAHQFPTGAVMSYRRRQRLLGWARDAGAFVFEDDYDAEFRYRGRPIESLRALDVDGCVIYAGTFSKTLFPALRIGYLVVPDELIETTRSVRWLAGWSNPTLEQAALGDFIANGHFERHVRRARVAYARRRAALLEALQTQCGDRVTVVGDTAGLHVLAWLDAAPRGGCRGLAERAREAGVGVYPVNNCFDARAQPPREGLVLGYSLLDEGELQTAIGVLASCW